jgi:hypothetical protein
MTGDTGGDREARLEVVASFGTLVDAEPCRSALVAAGFDVFAVDANTIAVDPGLWPGLGGVKLAVPSTQAEEARAFLRAAEDGRLAAAPEEVP